MTTPVTPQKIYTLVLYRKDMAHMTILETADEKEANAVWKELVTSWKTCVKEKVPFTLDKPFVTAFEPGLIHEIKVIITETTLSDNPYRTEMNDKGFGTTLNQYTRTSEMLDSGYKR